MPPKKQQGLDLHEIQRAMLEEEVYAERAGAFPPTSRAAPPISRGARSLYYQGPPLQQGPLRGGHSPLAEGFRGRPPRGEPYPPPGPGYYATRAYEAHAPTPPGRDLDVHELLKREAFASESAACDDHFEKNRPCPESVHGISDQYIVFDTFSKLRESQVERGEFRWNFMVQGVTGDQVLGVRDRIDTVIAIQVGAFALPILPEVPYVLAPPPVVTPSGTNQLVLIHNNTNLAVPLSPLLLTAQYPLQLPAQIPWVDNPYTQLPSGGRLTIQLREAGLQSYSDRNGARHHFEFGVAYPAGANEGANPNMLMAAPLRGGQWDTFLFTDPLKDVHGLTLVFRNPDVPIRFLPDCLYEVAAVSDGAAAPGPFLRFDAPAHGLLVGDRVFIEGFQSGVSALDTYVNRPEGQVISGDPSLPPLGPAAPLADSFWLDPAVSLIDLTAPPPNLPQIVTVCIAKRRMRIPMRLRRVVQRLTNYVQVVSS